MPPTTIFASALVAVAFLLIHVFSPRLRFLQSIPRSIWLSAAGGVSVAYVFVHFLPELAEHQELFRENAGDGGLLGEIERHAYLIALIGLSCFYGVERMARCAAPPEKGSGGERPGTAVFWAHLGAFALYNILIGYLLVHRENDGLFGLLAYGIAMGLHFLVNDQGLREHHGRVYDRKGRWILAAAPLLGWALGLMTSLSPLLLAVLVAFLGGGIVLNVLKEELPEDRESRFWAFAAGAALYAALLLWSA